MHQKIVELRALLAEKFPGAPLRKRDAFGTGMPWLDDVLHGGLWRGGITELVRPRGGMGSALVVLRLIRHCVAEGRPVALVDGRDSFEPAELSERERRSFLWVRCGEAGIAIRAADLLLRDGNLPVVVLDLAMNKARELERVPSMTWHRLQRVVEESGSACLAVTPFALVTSARERIELGNFLQLEDVGKPREELMGKAGEEVGELRQLPMFNIVS